MVKHNVLTPLRGRPNPYLPIVASPGAYTMDLMEVSSYVMDNPDNPLHAQSFAINANAHAGGYKYILVLIETTSRKLYAYPLKNKNSGTVFSAFEQFMKDCHGRIQYLTMDSGGEYAEIKRYLRESDLAIKVHEVVAAEGRHTVLSRVDRVIRTIREMLFNYFAQYNKYNWHKVLPQIVNVYNNTQHSALWLYKRGRERVYFTPEQVYNSSRLMKLISLKDTAMRKPGKKKFKTYTSRYGIKRRKYHYMVNTNAFMKGSKRGMLSKDTVKIKKRVGNSFKIKSDNPNLDGKIIPYRNLVRADSVIKKEDGKPSSRILSAMFSQLDKMIDLTKIETEEKKKKKPLTTKAERELRRLQRNNFYYPHEEKGFNKNIIEGRTRSQAKKNK